MLVITRGQRDGWKWGRWTGRNVTGQSFEDFLPGRGVWLETIGKISGPSDRTTKHLKITLAAMAVPAEMKAWRAHAYGAEGNPADTIGKMTLDTAGAGARC